MTNTVHGQYVRSCALPSPLTLGEGGPTPEAGAWQFVPSLCVSERYDSNVFFAPSTPGIQPEDFVTNIAPKVQVNHNGDYASGFVNAVGFNETYIKNPGLNYFGGGGNLSLNLNNSVKRLLPNATLAITDSVSYTPLPPGFVNPLAGTSPSDPVNPQNALARGLLTYRTNTLINNAAVTTTYATSASTRLEATYSNSIIRYGSSPLRDQANTLGVLFDTTTNLGSIAGFARLSGLDTVNVKYTHTDSVFKSGSTISFQTDNLTLGWSRTLTPSLMAEVAGGVIIVNPGLTTWAANGALIVTIPNYPVTLSYARTAFPSAVGVAAPLVGNTVSLSATQKLSREWQLVETANYSLSTGASPSTDSGPNKLEFTTYTASVDLYYWVTKVWSTALSFEYMNFDSEFAGTKYAFDRYVVTFGVKATLE